MTALPPLRDLPRHAERRDHLLAAIARPHHIRDRSRWLIPVAVAAAVALIAAGSAVVLRAVTDNESSITPSGPSPTASLPPEPTGSPTASPTGSTPPTAPAAIAPPPSHKMSSAEMAQAFDECTTGAAVEWRPVFEPVTGRRFELDESTGQQVVRSWVVARSRTDDHDQLVCVFHGMGLAVGHRFGSPIAKEPTYLRSPVEVEAAGFGRYVGSVTLVTYSTTLDGPEVRAVLDHGYWFAPVPFDSAEIVVRGYDGDGNLVFDSRELYDGCYADPSGDRVVERNTASPGVDPAECRRTYEWRSGS